LTVGISGSHWPVLIENRVETGASFQQMGENRPTLVERTGQLVLLPKSDFLQKKKTYNFNECCIPTK
jgi:hypothetical protein